MGMKNAFKYLNYLKAGLFEVTETMKAAITDYDKHRFRPMRFMYEKVKDVPDDITWNKIVSPAPLEKEGSCYVYVSVSIVEANLKQRNQYQGPLSVKEVIENDKQNNRYEGGSMYRSLYFMATTGVTNIRNHRVYIDGYEWVDTFENFKKVLVHQPLGVSIFAAPSFQNHKGRHLYFADITLTEAPEVPEVNHSVILSGFGEGYWEIRNSSWGIAWGNKGFSRLNAKQHMSILNCSNGGVYPVLRGTVEDMEDINSPDTLRKLFGIGFICRESNPDCLDVQRYLTSSYSIICNVYEDKKSIKDEILKFKTTDVDCESGVMYTTVCRINRLPRFLFVKVVRHSNIVLESYEKTFQRVDVPFFLDFTEFCTQHTGDHEVFNLVTVLIHEGSRLDAGQYISWIKQDNGRWLKVDFNSESQICSDALPDTSMAYVLMYEARPRLPLVEYYS